jgi:arylamine N-acetyltransferase
LDAFEPIDTFDVIASFLGVEMKMKLYLATYGGHCYEETGFFLLNLDAIRVCKRPADQKV